MKFELTILGNSTPYPSKGRFTTSQVLNVRNHLFLIDCGEGAQIRMNIYGIKRMRINHIFISHLHGDHYFGLFGLLGSYRLLRRTAPLHIYCPKGLEEMIALECKLSHAPDYPFPIKYHFNNPNQSELLVENKDLTVHSIPLKHGTVPTTGFLFREKPLPRKMLKSKLKEYNIPVRLIKGIKAGNDFIQEDGTVIKNEELTLPPPKTRSYAFCSDTAYNEAMLPQIKDVDLLYHEATFGSTMKYAEAALEVHSTTFQAGEIAKKANAGKLLIGHFSVRYDDLTPLVEETRTVFPNAHIAEEGKVFSVD